MSFDVDDPERQPQSRAHHSAAAVPGAADRVTPSSAVRLRTAETPSSGDEFIVSTYEAHQRELFTFALRSTRSAPVAEDVVSEAFLRFVNETREGRVPTNPRAWLYRVAANLIASQGRRSAVALRMRQLFVSRDVGEAVDVTVLKDEQFRNLHDALGTLPTDARMGLMLAAQGFSGDEIATIIGKSATATRTLLCRARMRLREQLADPGR